MGKKNFCFHGLFTCLFLVKLLPEMTWNRLGPYYDHIRTQIIVIFLFSIEFSYRLFKSIMYIKINCTNMYCVGNNSKLDYLGKILFVYPFLVYPLLCRLKSRMFDVQLYIWVMMSRYEILQLWCGTCVSKTTRVGHVDTIFQKSNDTICH